MDVFEGRRLLIAYYFMWHTGHPAPEQCEGCTWVTSQVRELSYIHSSDVIGACAEIVNSVRTSRTSVPRNRNV